MAEDLPAGARVDDGSCAPPRDRREAWTRWAARLAAPGRAELPDLRAADHDVPFCAGRTPLIAAVLAGRIESVKALLGRGADPDRHDLEGKTPLIHAVEADRQRASLHGAPARGWARLRAATAPWSEHDQPGDTSFATLVGHTDLMRWLGVKHNSLMRWLGVEADQPPIAAVLLERGCDPNRPDASGRTPLMYAEYLGLRDLANLLEASGADAEREDADGRTAADYRKAHRWWASWAEGAGRAAAPRRSRGDGDGSAEPAEETGSSPLNLLLSHLDVFLKFLGSGPINLFEDQLSA